MIFSKPRKYSHQPLVYWKSQIRLLRVEPDLYGPIRCSIEIFDLNKAPAYAALSYTWGPELPVYDIYVDSKTLPVRRNLHHFLKCRRKAKNKHFRSEKDLYIFIDQICIDQSDPEERNRQVQLMSRIYSKCWHVIVWLNDELGQCTRAAHAFNHTSKRVLAVAQLLKNDYFTRLWIVQELLLAPSISVFTPNNTWLSWPTIVQITQDVTFGMYLNVEESAAWELVPVNTTNLVLMTGKFIREGQLKAQSPAPPSKSNWLRFTCDVRKRTNSKNLLEILGFSANICHEPRDKVYGLMSLLKVEHRLSVDYNKPTYDVFKDAVIELHSVIDVGTDQSYKQWLEAAQRLGYEMGIDRNDIAELFALYDFVNLILPQRHHIAENDIIGLPTLVSMIGVEISDTPGVQLDPAIRKHHQHHSRSAFGGQDRDETNKRLRASSDMQPYHPEATEFLGLPPGLRLNQSMTKESTEASKTKLNAAKKVEFNVVQAISLYQEQKNDQETVTKQKRWDTFAQSILDTASLREKGLSLSWYYQHDCRISTYKITPNWDSIFRVSLSRMAEIVKEYENERINDERSRSTKERESSERLNQSATEQTENQVPKSVEPDRVPLGRAARVLKYLMYGWLGSVGIAMAGFLVLSCVADTIGYIVTVVLILWGLHRFASRPFQ